METEIEKGWLAVKNFVLDWLRACSRRYQIIRRYRWKLDAAEHSLSLADMEIKSLGRQLEAATDTIQAFGLHNRAIGMEAKVYASQIEAVTKP